MSRALWFVAGAGAGVYAVVRAKRAAELLTVDGLRDRVGAATVGARIFRDELAQGKADAETELRERLGVRLHEHQRALTARRPTPVDAVEADGAEGAWDTDPPNEPESRDR